ncbi:DUF1961 family protein [Kiritimatiellota bacterium B12222]|nr:DUF1961 family protein [Kiritimatiellota bacterium B12222]
MKAFIHVLLATFLSFTFLLADDANPTKENMAQFQKINQADWQEIWSDSGIERWQDKWMLDGKKATLENTPEGMKFQAGPIFGENASHAVLWSKQSFQGDIKIEYDYTRLDNETKCVNILYLHATGSGEGPYNKDVAEWADLREIPAMKLYFQNMNTYHISYAAYKNDNSPNKVDYIRARRYRPDASKSLAETDFKPDAFDTGLFKTNVPHKITIIKKGDDLFMFIRNADQERLCHWNTADLPPLNEGRIGLRHMYTRSARYANFTVSTLKK